MAINIRTSNLEVYHKILDLKIFDRVVFANTPSNRKYLAKIINNINYSNKHIEAILSDKEIILIKKHPFDFNIYFTKRR